MLTVISKIYLGPTAPNPDRTAIVKKVDEFLEAGGKISRVPGFKVRPLPPRKNPAPAIKVVRAPKSNPEKTAILIQWSAKVAELFKSGLLVADIARETGLPRLRVNQCLEHAGINKNEVLEKEEKPETELVERINLLAADRYTMRYAAEVIGITLPQLQHKANKHEIRFGR